MASSLRKAQSLLSCQLCDNPNVIKWKCQDCVMLMCDNCKERVHPKFKSSETHTVISIRDVRTEKDALSAQSGTLQIFKPVISSVLKTFTTDFPLIDKIQYSGNDTIYCNYNSAERGCKFFIMRLLNESVKILQSVDISYTDFALDTNDDIYFGEYGDSKLQVMSTDGVTKTIFSTPPMIIQGIHINKNNEIFLGLREQGPSFPVTDLCTRQIVVFQPKPIKEYAIEFDQNGKKMFSYVWRITTDSDNNIYAVDVLERNCNGRIVALDRTGSRRFIYTGHSSVNSPETPFKPLGIVISQKNNVIVSDMDNHTLHALNTKGEIIGIHTVTNLGIQYPYSLSFDSEGFLLIGCNIKKGAAPDAKIHVAKIAM